MTNSSSPSASPRTRLGFLAGHVRWSFRQRWFRVATGLVILILAVYAALRFRSLGQQLELSGQFGGTTFMAEHGLTLVRYVILPTALRTLQAIVLMIVISMAVRHIQEKGLRGEAARSDTRSG
jgi:hypothetical protein